MFQTILFFRLISCQSLLICILVAGVVRGQTTSFNLIEATVPEIQSAMDTGLISAESLIQQYLIRTASKA